MWFAALSVFVGDAVTKIDEIWLQISRSQVVRTGRNSADFQRELAVHHG